MRYFLLSTTMAASVALGAPSIELSPSGLAIEETTKGDKLAYAQVYVSGPGPNLNPRFDTWGRVPTSLAVSVKKALQEESSKIPDFPSVLIASFDAPEEEHQINTLVLGKHLDQRVAHALLTRAESLGIKRIVFSEIDHTFVIVRAKREANLGKDITNSIKEYFPSYNAEQPTPP